MSEITTVALPRDLKNKISEFGNHGETFANILERLLVSAKKRMLHDFLMDDKGYITIEEAKEKHKKRWSK